MHPAGLLRYVRQYEEFNPDYLLFTKLDETESYGPHAIGARSQAAKTPVFSDRDKASPKISSRERRQLLLEGLFGRERAEAISAA